MAEPKVEINCALFGSNGCGKQNLIYRYCEDGYYADITSAYSNEILDDE